MPDIDETLRQIWPEVRQKHLFPNLSPPGWNTDGDPAALEIRGKEITLSRKFVEKMSKDLGLREILEALLDHAISHYLYCPWDFYTHGTLQLEAKKVLRDRKLVQRATDLFIDVVANTYCLSQFASPLPLLYRHLNGGPVDEAIQALYQRIWGVDLGAQGHEEIARRLSRLPYLNRSQWRESMRRFARAIEPLLRSEKHFEEFRNQNPLGGHPLQRYSAGEIQKGLRQLVLEIPSPAEFKEALEDLALEVADERESNQGLNPGKPLTADIYYYMKLAENYSLPIRKRPREKNGSLYPHQHLPWELGRPFQDIDPWTSFGKILPGITQVWERREMEVPGEKEGVPNCIVLIDSSGSMPNPKEQLSFAVLGAACACEAYLKNQAQVAVCNFSDAQARGRAVLPFSRERKAIYRNLCNYFGGGTNLPVQEIATLQTDDLPDILLITDMQITNLETLIQYFNQIPNRVTAVHLGDNRQVQIFRQSLALRKNVGVYAVERKEDIPRIVLGKIREYFQAEAH
jgi:hypothetical protein